MLLKNIPIIWQIPLEFTHDIQALGLSLATSYSLLSLSYTVQVGPGEGVAACSRARLTSCVPSQHNNGAVPGVGT